MILAVTRMRVIPEKRMELSQTITSLCGLIRQETGCELCECCQGIEDDNRLFLLEEWDTQENLLTYLKSEYFSVIRGTMNLLQEPYERNHFTIQPIRKERLP